MSRGAAAATTVTAVVVGGGSQDKVVAGLANLTLSYLLLDFGGRRGRVDSAEQALVGANWNHSQVIQDVARNVTRAYHSYVGAKSQVVASQATLDEAQTSLEAVEVRRLSGVACCRSPSPRVRGRGRHSLGTPCSAAWSSRPSSTSSWCRCSTS